MKPGIYKLTRDVANPDKPDKRVKNDWRQAPSLAAGTVIIVDEEFISPDRGMIPRVRIVERFSTLNVSFEHHAWFKAIEASSPEPFESLEAVLCAAGSRPAVYILQRLLDTGVVTMDQIKVAIEQEKDA